MEDERKIETTIGGLKEAFAEWHLNESKDPDGFMTNEEVDAYSPEEYGEAAGEYFLGLLEQKDAPTTPSPR